MKKLFYLILFASLASCEEEQIIGPSGDVHLSINALFGDEPLVMNQPYSLGGGNQVKFDQLDFFVSNVALLEAETEDETDLLEIALANFCDNTSLSNVSPEVFTFKTVPAVKYRGIKIGIGVPSSLNKSSLANYGAGHPLKQNFDSHFWQDGGSFFFMKLSGVYDANGDGVFDEPPFELFPAKNANYTTVELDKAFTLSNGETLKLEANLDVLRLLQTADNQPIDLADPANLSTYDLENDDLSSLLMGNFEKAIELE